MVSDADDERMKEAESKAKNETHESTSTSGAEEAFSDLIRFRSRDIVKGCRIALHVLQVFAIFYVHNLCQL